MAKILSILLLVTMLTLSGCGSIRPSNSEPTPETQLDSLPPDLGNEEVNKENDEGTPTEKETNNDHLFEGVE